jgi:hypothetical protein
MERVATYGYDPFLFSETNMQKYLKIPLSLDARAIINGPTSGDGGFQSFHRSLQQNLRTYRTKLCLTISEAQNVVKQVEKFRQGGWENRLIDTGIYQKCKDWLQQNDIRAY